MKDIPVSAKTYYYVSAAPDRYIVRAELLQIYQTHKERIRE